MQRLEQRQCRRARTSAHAGLRAAPRSSMTTDSVGQSPQCRAEHDARPELLPPDGSGTRPIISAYGKKNRAMRQHAARARRSHRDHVMDAPPFDPVKVDSSRQQRKPVPVVPAGYRRSTCIRGNQMKPNAPPSDRDVLDELFRAAGGRRWLRRRGWVDADLARREGVKVDADGRVIALELAANNLMGSLPPSLGLLTRLQTLQVQHNKLSGAIPPQIFDSLPSLVAVSMHHNALSGLLPAALFRDKRALKYVHLAFNRFSGILPLPEVPCVEDCRSEEPLAETTALEQLHVQSNSLGCNAPLPWAAIGALRSLRVLNLANNNFCLQDSKTEAEALRTCAHLRLLDITGNGGDNHPANAAYRVEIAQELREALHEALHPSCAVLVDDQDRAAAIDRYR